MSHRWKKLLRVATAGAMILPIFAMVATSDAFARPSFHGHAGGGFDPGRLRPAGGGFHPAAGGGVHPRPVPHPPKPHPPAPHPGPNPGPRPVPPHPMPHPPPPPRPVPWVPGALVWGAAITDEEFNAYQDSIIYALPSSCGTVVVNGSEYARCGSRWYEMVYHGTQIAYVQVPDPR